MPVARRRSRLIHPGVGGGAERAQRDQEARVNGCLGEPSSGKDLKQLQCGICRLADLNFFEYPLRRPPKYSAC